MIAVPQHQYHNISRVLQPQLRSIGEVLASTTTKKHRVPLQLLKKTLGKVRRKGIVRSEFLLSRRAQGGLHRDHAGTK